MIELLAILSLAVHLTLVNVASAGPLVCILLDWKKKSSADVDWSTGAGRFLAWTSVLALLGGGVLGVLVGWLRWTPEFSGILSQFHSRIYFGVWEYFFSLALMVAAAFWLDRSRSTTLGRLGRTTLQLLAATNLLYHFPILLVIISDVSSGRTVVEGPVDSATFRSLMMTPGVLARSSHFWLACFALTGTTLMLYGLRKQRDSEALHPALTTGARIGLISTLGQLPVGLWLVTVLPQSAQRQILGGDPVGMLLFLASMILALALLHQLAAVSFGRGANELSHCTKNARHSVLTMLAVVVLMSGVLYRLNTAL